MKQQNEALLKNYASPNFNQKGAQDDKTEFTDEHIPECIHGAEDTFGGINPREDREDLLMKLQAAEAEIQSLRQAQAQPMHSHRSNRSSSETDYRQKCKDLEARLQTHEKELEKLRAAERARKKTEAAQEEIRKALERTRKKDGR